MTVYVLLFLEGKAISIRIWSEQAQGSWCSYMAEFSEITSQCSQRLSGWLGTILKAVLFSLMESLKRQSVSALNLFTRFPPHWSVWLTQRTQIWDLVLSFLSISWKECICLHLFYVFTFAMIQMHGIECTCCKCEFFFCWQIFTCWDCQLQDSIAFNKEKKKRMGKYLFPVTEHTKC